MNELMTNKMKKVKNKKGFTLIELIVVIAILGILAAIAIPRLSGFQDTAKARTNDSNVKMLQNAVRVFEAETGALPTDATDLEAAGYLGEVAPVPKITASAPAAVTNDVFQMDSDGVVTIGQDAAQVALSGVAEN